MMMIPMVLLRVRRYPTIPIEILGFGLREKERE